MWQGSQNLRAIQKKSCPQIKRRTGIGYISYNEEIIKQSSSNLQYEGVAAFELSERSPLPPPMSAKNLPGGRTHVWNIRRIRRIDHHQSQSDEDSVPDSIADTDNRVNWYGELHNPNESKDDCGADNEFDIEPCNGITASDSPEHQVVSAAPNICGWIWPLWRLMN
jgi:hypothetical protein